MRSKVRPSAPSEPRARLAAFREAAYLVASHLPLATSRATTCSSTSRAAQLAALDRARGRCTQAPPRRSPCCASHVCRAVRSSDRRHLLLRLRGHCAREPTCRHPRRASMLVKVVPAGRGSDAWACVGDAPASRRSPARAPGSGRLPRAACSRSAYWKGRLARKMKELMPYSSVSGVCSCSRALALTTTTPTTTKTRRGGGRRGGARGRARDRGRGRRRRRAAAIGGGDTRRYCSRRCAREARAPRAAKPRRARPCSRPPGTAVRGSRRR